MSDLIIKFKGGAGNQLFQAATALTLAKTYKNPVNTILII